MTPSNNGQNIRSYSFIAAATAAALQIAPSAYADLITRESGRVDGPCDELVKECFAYTGGERIECFYASSQHEYCEGGQLGALAFKRWSMSSRSNGGRDIPPNLLGPQLADQKCLDNFDSRWSSLLLEGSTSVRDIAQLDAALEQCRENPTLDILRP